MKVFDILKYVLLVFIVICVVWFIVSDNTVNNVWILPFLVGLTLNQLILLSVYKTREYRLIKLINSDTLTRAYNKRMLVKVFSEYKRENIPFSLIYLDIDKFKSINDNNGHTTGDLVLVDFVNRVLNAVREDDLLFRVGGDEFVLLVKGNSKDIVRDIIKRIYNSMDTSFDLVNTKLDISVSAGYSRYPIDADDLSNLIDIADSNMYREKRA